ncbi:MAG: hypothetical protein JXR58_13340 [Bacteroidales bacterium]|nr:hypothetical protein [Bacteroidales bacterium]
MKQLIFIFLTIFSINISAQLQDVFRGKGDTLEVIFYYSTGKIQSKGKTRFSLEEGRWKYYDKNEKLIQETDFEQGVVNGKLIYYYSNGKKESESNYLYGVQHGKYTIWYNNGNKEIEGNYSAGQKDSIWSFFYLNGKTKKQLVYEKEDVKMLNYWAPNGSQLISNGNGLMNLTFSNGNLMEKGSYVSGKAHGEWIYGYENGNTMSKGTYSYGKETGKWTNWYEEGAKKSEMNYDNGENIIWYESGKKMMEGKMKDGEKDGVWTFWYEDGSKQMIAPYLEGKRHGITTRWYKNGNRELEMEFSYGQQHGKATWWKNDGSLDIEGNFKNDIQHGKWTYYRENGKKGNEGNYYEGKMDGTWTYWYNFDRFENLGDKTLIFYGNDTSVLRGNYKPIADQIWKTCNYEKGMKQGLWTIYFENGQKYHEGNFENGLEEGEWTSWYENGKMESQGEFVNGIINGLWKKWHFNGVKLSEIELSMGLKSGIAAYWNEFGELEKEENFILVDVKKNSDKIYVDENVIEKKSILHGKYIVNFPNGKPNILGSYFYGKKDGKWEIYAALGRIDFSKLNSDTYSRIEVRKVKEEYYKKGNPHGEWKSWYEEGMQESVINYKEGAKHGKIAYYEKTGRVIYEAIYKMNEKQKVIIDANK